MLFVWAELANFVDDRSEQGLGREGAVAAQGFDEAFLSEFFAGIVKGFCDAVGVESEGITGKELALPNFAIPLFEDAENGGGGVKTLESIVAAEEKSA